MATKTAATTSRPPKKPFIIRPTHIRDINRLSTIASKINWNYPLDIFLSPFRDAYPEDHKRMYTQRMVLRFLSPRNLSFVVCSVTPEGTAGEPIGHIQMNRLGDNESAKKMVKERDTWSLWAARGLYTYWYRVKDYLWPNRSGDPKNIATFLKWVEDDDKKYWSSNPDPSPASISSTDNTTANDTPVTEDRTNRWHVQSLFVSEDWQSQGVGTALMEECLSRARKDGVVIGIEASEQGEHLYRKLGFELLGRFKVSLEQDKQVGGIFIWRGGVGKKDL